MIKMLTACLGLGVVAAILMIIGSEKVLYDQNVCRNKSIKYGSVGSFEHYQAFYHCVRFGRMPGERRD